MENLHLRISKIIKGSAVERLRSIDPKSTALLPRTALTLFSAIRSHIVYQLNKFPKTVHNSSNGYGITVDYSKHCAITAGGIFTESGLMVMLQASAMRLLDKLFPILVTIIDCCGDETTTALVTKLFTNYSDML